jgi:hypothetical protein
VDAAGERPRFFSIQFVPRPQWVALDSFDHRDVHTADDFDTVSKVVRSLKGKSVQVRTAVEFERAIEGIEFQIRAVGEYRRPPIRPNVRRGWRD